MPSSCAVPGCEKSAIPKFHALPQKNESQAREWLRRIENPKYPEGIVDIQEVYNVVRICGRHFSEHCFIPPQYHSNKGIKDRSLPTLHLPTYIEPTVENSFCDIDKSQHPEFHTELQSEDDVGSNSVKVPEQVPVAEIPTSRKGSNCEQDNSDGAFGGLLERFLENVLPGKNKRSGVTPFDELPKANLEHSLPAEVTKAETYVAGYVVKRLLPKVACTVCREDLVSANVEDEHRSDAQIRSSREFLKTFAQCCKILNDTLPQICSETQLKLKLKTILSDKCTFAFSCSQHKLQHELFDVLAIFFIQHWVMYVNKMVKRLGPLINVKRINLNVPKMAHAEYLKLTSKKTKI